MDGKNIDNGLYVIGVTRERDTSFYQVTVADNFVEIRDFTTHAKLLDLIPETADDVRRILGRILGNHDNANVIIDEVVERCSWRTARSCASWRRNWR